MGTSADILFQRRFKGGIHVNYGKPQTGEEREISQRRLAKAIEALMAHLLQRPLTREELLGIVPINFEEKGLL